MAEQPRNTRGDDGGDDRRNDGGTDPAQAAADDEARPAVPPAGDDAEVGGPKGPEPTRFGDWERKGRCIDF
jgi:hypothetical protein